LSFSGISFILPSILAHCLLCVFVWPCSCSVAYVMSSGSNTKTSLPLRVENYTMQWKQSWNKPTVRCNDVRLKGCVLWRILTSLSSSFFPVQCWKTRPNWPILPVTVDAPSFTHPSLS
jgi:hypothetical protein